MHASKPRQRAIARVHLRKRSEPETGHMFRQTWCSPLKPAWRISELPEKMTCPDCKKLYREHLEKVSHEQP